MFLFFSILRVRASFAQGLVLAFDRRFSLVLGIRLFIQRLHCTVLTFSGLNRLLVVIIIHDIMIHSSLSLFSEKSVHRLWYSIPHHFTTTDQETRTESDIITRGVGLRIVCATGTGRGKDR